MFFHKDFNFTIGRPGIIVSYKTKIENAYDSLFDSLENMFPNADRRDSDLLSAVMAFSTTYSEVYFEMGILVGMQIYKNLDQPQAIDLMNIFTIFIKTVHCWIEKVNSSAGLNSTGL